MHAILFLILLLIRIYIWVVFAQAILSMLVSFSVVNRYNPAVKMIGDFLYRATEPALRPIRNFLPNLGAIDLSPFVLGLILLFLYWLIEYDIAPALLS